jgi:hypothetical protein
MEGYLIPTGLEGIIGGPASRKDGQLTLAVEE